MWLFLRYCKLLRNPKKEVIGSANAQNSHFLWGLGEVIGRLTGNLAPQNMKIKDAWEWERENFTSSGTMGEAHSGKLLATPSHAQQC